MKKKMISCMLMAALTASLVLSGCAAEDTAPEVTETETSVSAEGEVEINEEAETAAVEAVEWTVDVLALIPDVISGIGGEISVGSDSSAIRDLLSYDENIVVMVTFDPSAVDFNTAGAYDVNYSVLMDVEALENYVTEYGLDASVFSGLSDTSASRIFVKVAGTITVVGIADAEESIEADDTAEKTQEDDGNEGASAASVSGTVSSSSGTETTSSGNITTSSGSSSSKVGTSSASGSASASSSYAACSHNWVAQTTKVYHEEEGHYETVQVDETVICNYCGQVFSTDDEWENHWIQMELSGQSGHGAYTVYPAHTTSEWVVDKAASTETVTIGYRCSICGATK